MPEVPASSPQIEDQLMPDVPSSGDPSSTPTDPFSSVPPLSALERDILALFDRLNLLTKEIALLQASRDLQYSSPSIAVGAPQPTEEELATAQRELLESKAQHALSERIVDNVVRAPAILKAVHAGERATAVEKDILPPLAHLNDLSFELSRTSTSLSQKMQTLTSTSVEHHQVSLRNKELAAELLELADQLKDKNERWQNVRDATLRRQLDEAEQDMKESRMRWRIMKDTAAAVVAGSGIDWSRDDVLKEVVLDADDV